MQEIQAVMSTFCTFDYNRVKLQEMLAKKSLGQQER